MKIGQRTWTLAEMLGVFAAAIALFGAFRLSSVAGLTAIWLALIYARFRIASRMLQATALAILSAACVLQVTVPDRATVDFEDDEPTRQSLPYRFREGVRCLVLLPVFAYGSPRIYLILSHRTEDLYLGGPLRLGFGVVLAAVLMSLRKPPEDSRDSSVAPPADPVAQETS